MTIDIAVYELQDQIKELLKRVEELESTRCHCTTCQNRDYMIWRAKEQVTQHEEEV